MRCASTTEETNTSYPEYMGVTMGPQGLKLRGPVGLETGRTWTEKWEIEQITVIHNLAQPASPLSMRPTLDTHLQNVTFSLTLILIPNCYIIHHFPNLLLSLFYRPTDAFDAIACTAYYFSVLVKIKRLNMYTVIQ